MSSPIPTGSLTTWRGTDSSLSHVKLLQISSTNSHSDLLAFLSVAQATEVDFVPLAWYPSFHLGRGGFALLSQTPVKAEMSFAFKRLVERGTDDDGTAKDLSASIVELSILSHRPIIMHPNIINLEGICWEVTPNEDRILPVLILEKAPYGDLLQFRDTDEGKSISVADKLKLCLQMLDALFTLHTSCKKDNPIKKNSQGQLLRQAVIAHGDLKPQNMLVFKAQDGTLTLKLSDFGNSAIGNDRNDLCTLPRSEPWTAPEWHHRKHTITNAMKMDVYSFALVCFWLLIENAFGLTDTQATLRVLRDHKRSNTLVSKACEVVQDLNVASSTKNGLNSFFQLTLNNSSRKQIRNIAQLIPLLDPEAQMPLAKLKGSSINTGERHVEFHVSHNFYVLLFTNYLVRKFITENFRQKAAFSQCEFCQNSAAFELAFCHYVGFGVRRDHSVAQALLKQSGRKFDELEEEMDEIVDFCLYRNKTVIDLGLDGYSMVMDHVSEYCTPNYDVTSVKNVYRDEIADLGEAFSHDPLITATLRATLANILAQTGELQEAEDLYRDLIRFFLDSTEHGRNHPTTLSCQSNLGYILSEQGKNDEAGTILRKAVADQESLKGKDHPDTLQSAYILSSFLSGIREHAEARPILEHVTEVRKRILSENHTETLKTMNNLACVYCDLEMLDQAEQLHNTVLTTKRNILGKNHYDTLTTMANLAFTYSSQGRFQDAQSLESRVLELRREALGESDPATLTAKGNLASTYFSQGRLEEAARLQREVVDGRQRVLGRSHQLTLLSSNELLRSNLAQQHAGNKMA